MDLQRYMKGRSVELPEMLAARERRGQVQSRLLTQYPMTMVCLTLNIAGPNKVFPLSRWAFDEGVARIQNLCAAYGFPIRHAEELREDTGFECFLSVEAPGAKVKGALMALEEEDPLGRLLDLDVLDSRGRKVSREDLGKGERTCLLCGNPAFLCSRNRAHSLEAIQRRTCEILEEAFRNAQAERVGALAVMALLREVQTTPKPGLVDMAGSGAHRDMDLETFERSALALLPYFREFYLFAPELTPEELLSGLRPIGIRAEGAMRSATGGVNTHKGVIFSMGILLAALGRFPLWEGRPSREELREMCKKIAAPLAADFEDLAMQTHGGALYQKHGIRGARGEALAGFPSLFDTGLPVLTGLLEEGTPWNEAGVVTLLHIMAKVEDSNTIARSSVERARELRQDIAYALSLGKGPQTLAAYAERLDKVLTHENISPGGSADILALSFFLHSLEKEGYLKK